MFRTLWAGVRLGHTRTDDEIGMGRSAPESGHEKTPPKRGSHGLDSLADLRRIAEGDREEQGCNRKRENEDVSEAFHLRTPLKGDQLSGEPAGGT